MNKLMIALGIALLMGLSFAGVGPWQYDWQKHVAWRYWCNYNDLADEQYYIAYAYFQPYATLSQISSMGYYLGLMYGELWGNDGDTGMVWEYYPTPFRADMMGYNSANSLFRTVFLSAYRSYLVATGDPGGVVSGHLYAVNSEYMECATSTPWM